MVPADQQLLVRSLALYADALAQDNSTEAALGRVIATQIQEGYQPGCIGDIASLHARFYAEHWGFGVRAEGGDRTCRVRGTLPAHGKALGSTPKMVALSPLWQSMGMMKRYRSFVMVYRGRFVAWFRCRRQLMSRDEICRRAI
jgi:hypothetical protein